MSILIKGMEMPTSCNKCPFLDYEEGFCFASGVKHESGWYESTLCPGGIKDGRHDECPLVPVPPHGRLIDADALRQSIKESIEECHAWAEEVNEGEMYARVSQALGTFVECSLRVKAAPTIIEAEEGE
jgi:hypothetical protein